MWLCEMLHALWGRISIASLHALLPLLPPSCLPPCALPPSPLPHYRSRCRCCMGQHGLLSGRVREVGGCEGVLVATSWLPIWGWRGHNVGSGGGGGGSGGVGGCMGALLFAVRIVLPPPLRGRWAMFEKGMFTCCRCHSPTREGGWGGGGGRMGKGGVWGEGGGGAREMAGRATRNVLPVGFLFFCIPCFLPRASTPRDGGYGGLEGGQVDWRVDLVD